MKTPTHPLVLVAIPVGILVLGLAGIGLDNEIGLPWLRTVGLVFALCGVALLCLPALAPLLLFLAWLDWIGLFPLTRIAGWVFRRIDGIVEGDDRRTGREVLIEDQYRLFVSRKAPVRKPQDLRRAVNRLTRGLHRIGGRRFALCGYTPAMRRCHLRWLGFSRAGYFLEHSQIQWNFGRERSDPTHRLIFFTPGNDEFAVYLSIYFVTEGTDATCPGLYAELRMTQLAVGTDGRCLERMFRLLIETLDADFGHIELPGEPEETNWPHAPCAGSLTFTTGAIASSATRSPLIKVKPCGRGSLLIANVENLKLCEQS